MHFPHLSTVVSTAVRLLQGHLAVRSCLFLFLLSLLFPFAAALSSQETKEILFLLFNRLLSSFLDFLVVRHTPFILKLCRFLDEMWVKENEALSLQTYKVKSLAGAATHRTHEYVLLPENVPDGAHIIRLNVFPAQHRRYYYKATVTEVANRGFFVDAPMH